MVRTDSVSRTVAVFVISHKNNLFSEIILKSAPSRWLLKWGGKIFRENTLTKPHFCRDRWGGISHGASSNFTKINYSPKHVKNQPVSWAQYMRGSVQALWNWKNLEKHLYFCPFWMPTTWGGFWAACTKTKIFVQNALTKPRFRRDRWRGIAPLHVPWQFYTHSSDTFSPTRAGRPCAMTILCERQPRASTAR